MKAALPASLKGSLQELVLRDPSTCPQPSLWSQLTISGWTSGCPIVLKEFCWDSKATTRFWLQSLRFPLPQSQHHRLNQSWAQLPISLVCRERPRISWYNMVEPRGRLVKFSQNLLLVLVLLIIDIVIFHTAICYHSRGPHATQPSQTGQQMQYEATVLEVLSGWDDGNTAASLPTPFPLR